MAAKETLKAELIAAYTKARANGLSWEDIANVTVDAEKTMDVEGY